MSYESKRTFAPIGREAIPFRQPTRYTQSTYEHVPYILKLVGVDFFLSSTYAEYQPRPVWFKVELPVGQATLCVSFVAAAASVRVYSKQQRLNSLFELGIDI